MKFLLFANTDWYLYHFRASLASAIRTRGIEVLLVSPSGLYSERLQELGFRWIEAPMSRRSLNPLKELTLLFWLWRLIRRENVDLVHGFTIKCAIYGSLSSRLAGNRPRVAAAAGLGYVFSSVDLQAKVLRPVIQLIMRLSFGGKRSRLILQNPDDVRLFEQTKIADPSRIRLIRGSGVNCAGFRRSSLRRAGEPLRVLLAARLLWQKGLDEYAQAARILKMRGRKVHFILAGRADLGNPDSVPEKVLHGWVEEGIVDWIGHVETMPHLLSTVHVMALPTTYGEGVPRSLIEGAASGLALVATNVPGCREVITDGVDGLLIQPQSAEALAAAIARLDDDPEFAAQLGDAARHKALTKFDERIVIEQTLAVYDELIANRAPEGW